MERRTTPRNSTEQLLFQGRADLEDTERREAGVVEKIEPVDKGGKKYQRLEYTDGDGQAKFTNVFNPHLIEGLKEGDAVDFVFKKGKSDWWNLKEVIRPEKPKDEFVAFFESKDAPTDTPKEPAAVQASFTEMPTPLEQARIDKEKGMRAMNAMTATSTYMSALVNAGIVKPTDLTDALKAFGSMHSFMMALHDQPNDRRNTPTDTK